MKRLWNDFGQFANRFTLWQVLSFDALMITLLVVLIVAMQ